MKTLVIGDLHHHVDWVEECLAEEKHDKVVFLGDYFDDFGDTPKDAEKTALWLKKSLGKKNRKHILGNHDIPYRWPRNKHLECPGFSEEKCKVVKEILKPEEWKKTCLCYFSQDYLFSHGGAHPYIFSHPIHGMTVEGILQTCLQSLQDAQGGVFTPVLTAGHERGGFQRYGGITWCDWRLLPKTPGVKQIVGHTPAVEPRQNGDNWCFDCFNNYIGVLEDGKVTVIENKWKARYTPKYGVGFVDGL